MIRSWQTLLVVEEKEEEIYFSRQKLKLSIKNIT